MDVQDMISKNYYKQTADKIRDNLAKIRNNPKLNSKRWIWELIQNSKDVPNKFQKVSIEIEYFRDKLIYKHNGMPFTMNNILGLLQQVSTKDSQNSEEQTGKFGTGFICTHLLSEIIQVQGKLDYKGTIREFNIELNREGKSSEELLVKIEESLEKIRTINKNFKDYPEIKKYNQKETDYDTQFTYLLKGENQNNIAQGGLDDLINTLPVTLITLNEKIKQVKIIDHIKNNETLYYAEETKINDNVSNFRVNVNIKENGILKELKIIDYLTYLEPKILRLIIEIKMEGDKFFLVEPKNDQPMLYRNFPLIGSNKFNFPFILDGFNFYPLETRNGIYLNGDLNDEAKENRKMVLEAINITLKFNKYIVNNNIGNKYLLANTKLPEPPEPFDKIANDWFINIQKNWRGVLADYNIVRDNKDNYYPLKSLGLPVIKRKTNESFYHLIYNGNIRDKVIPHIQDYVKWYNIIIDEYERWGKTYLYEENDLFEDISKLMNLDNLSKKINKNEKEMIDWLNSIYELFSSISISYFKSYKIIPNQYGKFLFF